MFNDLQMTVMAGGVVHLEAGADTDHYPWAVILRDARLNALPGTALSRIHYDALQAWFVQFPGDKYALSTVALGMHVVPADVATDVAPSPSPEAESRHLMAMNNVGTQPTFAFSLESATAGTLRIVDVSGRHVTTLREGRLGAGRQQYTWLGKDNSGSEVASGIYFGILTTEDGRSEVAKVVIVR